MGIIDYDYNRCYVNKLLHLFLIKHQTNPGCRPSLFPVSLNVSDNIRLIPNSLNKVILMVDLKKMIRDEHIP